ncbi:MAG TPA: hypothetical protein VGH81_14435 [Rudaea sp.]|jgi:hypothetical protein
MHRGIFAVLILISISFGIAAALAAPSSSPALLIAGNNSVGTTDYPQGGMRRVGKLTLSDPLYKGLYSAVYDGSQFAYFGTSHGAYIIKVDVSGPTPVQVGVVQCPSSASSAVIDSGAGYAWFGGQKVQLDDGTANHNMICLGSTAPVLRASGMVIDLSDPDPVRHFILASNGGNPSVISKIAPGAGNAAPTVVGTVTLNAGESGMRRAVLDGRDADATNHAAIFASAIGTGAGANAVFVKVAFGPSTGLDQNPVRIGATTPDAGDIVNIGTAGIDAGNGVAYFGTYGAASAGSERIIKIALGASGQAPVRLGHLQLATGEILLSTGVIDAASGFAWLGNDLCYPANIFKVNLATFSETSDLTLQGGDAVPPPNGINDFDTPETKYGEVFLQSSVIDANRGYAFFGTDSSAGQVIKVALSQKSAVKATRVVLADVAFVKDIDFYAHAANGNVRLAIYDDTPQRNLLWQSPTLAASAGWISAAIASGQPAPLSLPSGSYWLAWQVDSIADIPSYTPGLAGDGWFFEQAYGDFPAAAPPVTSTDETWSIYIHYAGDLIFADGFNG